MYFKITTITTTTKINIKNVRTFVIIIVTVRFI